MLINTGKAFDKIKHFNVLKVQKTEKCVKIYYDTICKNQRNHIDQMTWFPQRIRYEGKIKRDGRGIHRLKET